MANKPHLACPARENKVGLASCTPFFLLAEDVIIPNKKRMPDQQRIKLALSKDFYKNKGAVAEVYKCHPERSEGSFISWEK